MSLLPSRKLLLLNHTNVTTTTTTTTTTHINSVDSITSSSSSSSSAPILVEQTGRGGDREVHDEGNSYPPPCCFNSFRLNPPFDSAMALTVLVLLTALFFMGFFSIYVRRFADENSVDPTRSRRRRNTAAAAPAARLPPGKKGGRGVDPTVIESLPAFSYAGRDLEQGEGEAQECAICLGEFEKRERVKSIPYCGHVFHATCLDTWLSSHVTCPLCRTAELFPSAVPEKNKEGTTKTTTIECDTRRRQVEEGERDTCEEVGTRRVRRTSSWSWDGERVRLHRSLSF